MATHTSPTFLEARRALSPSDPELRAFRSGPTGAGTALKGVLDLLRRARPSPRQTQYAGSINWQSFEVSGGKAPARQELAGERVLPRVGGGNTNSLYLTARMPSVAPGGGGVWALPTLTAVRNSPVRIHGNRLVPMVVSFSGAMSPMVHLSGSSRRVPANMVCAKAGYQGFCGNVGRWPHDATCRRKV